MLDVIFLPFGGPGRVSEWVSTMPMRLIYVIIVWKNRVVQEGLTC